VRVLVTGAARGIGRATCLRLARDAKAAGRKAQIAAVDLGPSPALAGLVRELGDLGAAALPLSGDMATADSPARVVDEAIARFGGLDGVVSNAGVGRPGPLAQYAVEDWDRMFAVNTRAVAPPRRPTTRRRRAWAIVAVIRNPAATRTRTWVRTGRARPR
jgi:NAD(P)-dependent dehydrogenase (short-subunit alcohol dehydrogenase family)